MLPLVLYLPNNQWGVQHKFLSLGGGGLEELGAVEAAAATSSDS